MTIRNRTNHFYLIYFFALLQSVANLFSLINLFIIHGNLRTKRLDFHSWRSESLRGLETLLPHPLEQVTTHKGVITNSILFNLLSASSEIKNSFSINGAHLQSTPHKLFYVRIPKAASTSVAREMLGLIKPETIKVSLTSTQLNFLTDAWFKTDVDELSGLTGFTIVRHPLDRLVSVYRDIFNPERELPFIYQNYLGGVLQKNISFDEFVSRISQIPDRLKDQHLKPQHLFIKPYQQRGLDIKILKLDNPESIREFMNGYGMDFPHLNKNTGANFRESYSQKSLKTAQKMYVHDFSVFSYEQF